MHLLIGQADTVCQVTRKNSQDVLVAFCVDLVIWQCLFLYSRGRGSGGPRGGFGGKWVFSVKTFIGHSSVLLTLLIVTYIIVIERGSNAKVHLLGSYVTNLCSCGSGTLGVGCLLWEAACWRIL